MTTLDTRTPQEIAYDSLKDGSAYFKPQPAAEDADYDPWADIIDTLAGVEHQPFGTLADGTPILGQFNMRAPKRWGVVHSRPAGWSFCVDDGGHISGSSVGEEPSIDIDGATVEQLRELAALVNAGVFDHLLAAAEAWGRGDEQRDA
jgi:hypothetical protein